MFFANIKNTFFTVLSQNDPGLGHVKNFPNPTTTFAERLKLSDSTDGKEPDMKHVYNIRKEFTSTFSDSKFQDWSNHIDLLETTVFATHNFGPKHETMILRDKIYSHRNSATIHAKYGIRDGKPRLEDMHSTMVRAVSRRFNSSSTHTPFQSFSVYF